MENYREVPFSFGTIDEAVKRLQLFGEEKIYLVFNGQKIYPNDDIDSAYKKVTGMTKTEFDEERRAENEKYINEKKEHEENIPKLTEEWIKKGIDVFDLKYQKQWSEIVPIRLADLYRGFELEACLEIVLALNNGYTLKEAKEIIENQGHSGMSFALVSSMVNVFCDRGADFVEYIKS